LSAEFQKQSYAVTPQAISIEIERERLYLGNGQGVLISHTLSSGAAMVQLLGDRFRPARQGRIKTLPPIFYKQKYKVN
jgi:hypothetical protein